MSVVVPARDAEGSLPALLQSLERQSLPRDRFEVVVVENGSRDRTAEVAERHGARVVRERAGNRSRARNAGVHSARAGFIAFTDADCVAAPTWLEEMLACRGGAPLLAGPVVVAAGARANAVERFESLWRFSQEHWVAEGWAATANLCVERSAFAAVGGFDARYRHIGEDADFCIRAGRAGFPLGYCAGALIAHDPERRLGPVLRRAFFHGYSSAQVLARLGVGHAAWRDPRPLASPRAALARLGIAPEALPRRERLELGALASASYVSRVGGSLWAQISGAR